jgi:hypothetical protein
MASCTRKFFKQLAAEYKDVKPDDTDPNIYLWCAMVGRTARVLKAENGNFDVDRFLEAAGLTVPAR